MKKDKKEHNSENECEQASENNENLTEEIEAAAEKIDREAEALKAENAKLKDDYLRAYAELENTKSDAPRKWRKTPNMPSVPLPRKFFPWPTICTGRLPLPKS